MRVAGVDETSQPPHTDPLGEWSPSAIGCVTRDLAKQHHRVHSRTMTVRGRGHGRSAVLCSALLTWSVIALPMPSAAAATAPTMVTTVSEDVAAAVPRERNGRLVFTRAVPLGLDEQRNEIYSSRPNGTDLRRLTHTGENNSPQWGPAGKRIIFGRGNGSIVVMGANGGHKQRVLGGRSSFSGEPAWAPHGHRIVFIRRFRALVVYSLETGKRWRITGDFARPSSPSWSPNGRRILFAGTAPGMSEVSDIYTIRPHGSGLRNLTATPRVHESNPDWSPNGHRAVYVREGSGCRTLHTMRADGSRNRRVPRSCPADNPAWSPNGRKIAFNPRPETSGSRVWSMSQDGSHKRFVTEGSSPDWQPTPSMR